MKTRSTAGKVSVKGTPKTRSNLFRWLVAWLLLSGLAMDNLAVITFTGGSYSQDFDTLTTSTTSQTWVNDSTLQGWSLFTQPSGGTAATSYLGGSGTSSAGGFYSFGNLTDRALGGVGSGGAYFGSAPSGSIAGWIAVALKNESGGDYNSITLSFAGEQWRNGGNADAQTMALQYGFGSTFGSVTTWISPGGNFDYASPETGSSAAAVDGNVAGKVSGLGGTISTTWNNGETLWIRWIENNDAGNDHGLAIDDFSITATPIPEPSTFIAGALLALPFGWQGVRYLRNRKRA
jgi:hypothetical protein